MMKSAELALALAGVITFLSPPSCSKQQTKAAPGPPEVLVTEVLQQDVDVTREWVATLDGYVNAVISARVSGYLISQKYREGSSVKKGELLFEIDPRPFVAALEEAKAMVAKAQTEQVKAELDEKRAVELYKTRAVSEADRDNAVQANAAAKAVIEGQKASVDTATLNLEFTKVVAPVDGIVGFPKAQVGDLVSPSSGELATISQVDPIKAVVISSEQGYLDFAKKYSTDASRTEFEKTREYDLIMGDGSTYPQKGHFFAVDRNVDVRTGSIRFEALFPNAGNYLRPGQFARLHAKDKRKDALLIPQVAMIELQGNYQVAVVDDQKKVTLRTVKAGERIGSMWIIEDGLKKGETVVVQGLQKVREGSVVVTKPYDTSNNKLIQEAPLGGK